MKRLVSALVVGAFTNAPAADLCFGPSHTSGSLVSVVCTEVPTAVPNDWTGYDTDGPACASGQCFVAARGGPQHVCWTISSSSVDPFANSGAFPAGTLYLWLVFSEIDGLQAAEFRLEGDMNVVAVEAMNGFLRLPSPDPREVLLVVGGCPPGPVVAARIQIDGTVGVDPETWGAVKSVYR